MFLETLESHLKSDQMMSPISVTGLLLFFVLCTLFVVEKAGCNLNNTFRL